jgi:hypothetical protein
MVSYHGHIETIVVVSGPIILIEILKEEEWRMWKRRRGER